MFKLKTAKLLIIAAAFSLFFSQQVYAASYTVVKGDTLSAIAKVFNTTYVGIMNTNSLPGSLIKPGQILEVPGTMYTVQSGDCLTAIAKKYRITLYSLGRANNIWTDRIIVGQKLTIPTIQTVTQSTTIPGTAQAASVIPYTASDLDLLARLITAEAENQPYSAKVAVGAVVVNRVQDNQFPDTIRGVIYQVINGYYQFTPVLNGTINKAASSDAKNAAYAALHGSDPSKGALFYFDDSATNKWLWSKPLAARIDDLVFVY